MKKILTILAVILLLNVFGSSVFAEDDKEKDTYTVTVSAGLHGMLEDENGNKVQQINVQIKAGGEWNPNDYVIKQEDIDELYYFKGYHIAGIEGSLAGAQDITHDIVFVASYGIENNLVEYYVNYVDENGNGIGPVRNTYVGNVGDKPVVAFVHINGYAPKVRNYTGTLTEDEVLEFTFEYRENRIDTIEYIEDEIEGSVYNGTVPGQENVPGEEPGSETQEPIDIIDIDEDNTPAAEPDNIPDGDNEGQTETNSFLSFLRKYGLLLGGGLLVLFLLLSLFLLLRRRKEDEE